MSSATPVAQSAEKQSGKSRSYWKVRSAINFNLPNKRRLTDKEEIFAGKLSKIAKELEKKKKTLEKTLQRDLSLSEWATASNLSLEELKQTVRLSQLAREKLIMHNLRLIDFVVCELLDRRPASFSADVRQCTSLYSGLFQQGVVGLKKAAEYYDGRYKFSYFAVHFIRQECYRYLTMESIENHVPHKIMLTGIRINNMRKRLTEELQRPPTDEELGEKLSFSTHRIHKVLNFIKKKSNVKSLQAELPSNSQANENYDTLTYGDSLARSTPIEDKIGTKVVLDYLHSGVLSDEEVQAIMWKYGLSGNVPNPKQIGSALHMRPDKAEQYIERALQKLSAVNPLKVGKELINKLLPTVGFASTMSESMFA